MNTLPTKLVVVALIAFLIGVCGTLVVQNDRGERGWGSTHTMSDGKMMYDNNTQGMHGAMGYMMDGLTGKTGDAFDKAFLSEMIVHHQGAVTMAEAALKDAKHAEIKDMAQAIISAQTTEITQMQDWQKAWYKAE